MHTLICGSVAFDTIMVFGDHFKNHILPEKIHILNVAFLVPDMRREFGGCAANIAYNLQALGGSPLMMAAVGDDYAPYAARFEHLGLSQRHVRVVPGSFTAQAFITTDLADNQITAFHPGAMNFSHYNHVADAVDAVDAAQPISLGIISPDGREGMLQHAREFADAGIPFVFDPGQGLPMFDGEALLQFIEQAKYVTVNDYEAQLLQERTGHSLAALAQRVDALVVTLGEQGSTIYTGGQQIAIPCVKASELVDPTGCGDAYRAGLLYGIAQGYDWQTTGQLASLMGAIKIAHRGGQNHPVSTDEIGQRYFETFDQRLW